MSRALFALILFFPCIALACRAPDWRLLAPKNLLINDAHTIVLAKAKKYHSNTDDSIPTHKNHRLDFLFTVEENLKGKPITEISLLGYDAAQYKVKPSDLDGHQKATFWRRGSGGNATMAGDCRAYGTFEIDQQYLLILKEGFHINSFELVNSKDDLWYQYVKEQVDNEDELAANLWYAFATGAKKKPKKNSPDYDVTELNGSKFGIIHTVIPKWPDRVKQLKSGEIIATARVTVDSNGFVVSSIVNPKVRVPRVLKPKYMSYQIKKATKKWQFSKNYGKEERDFIIVFKFNSLN